MGIVQVEHFHQGVLHGRQVQALVVVVVEAVVACGEREVAQCDEAFVVTVFRGIGRVAALRASAQRQSCAAQQGDGQQQERRGLVGLREDEPRRAAGIGAEREGQTVGLGGEPQHGVARQAAGRYVSGRCPGFVGRQHADGQHGPFAQGFDGQCLGKGRIVAADGDGRVHGLPEVGVGAERVGLLGDAAFVHDGLADGLTQVFGDAGARFVVTAVAEGHGQHGHQQGDEQGFMRIHVSLQVNRYI